MSSKSERDYYQFVENSEYKKYFDFYPLPRPNGDNQTHINLPLTSSIDIKYYSETHVEKSRERARLFALENTINRNRFLSNHFNFNSELGDKSKQELVLISIPSILFGNSIKKGSVSLKIHYSGTLVSEIADKKNNGELIQIYPTSSNYTVNSSCAGIVLYNQGFIILTGSWDLGNGLRWSSYSAGSEDVMASGSFDLDYNGINQIETMTIMSNAPKDKFNFSNNPTFITYNQDKLPLTSSNGYYEIDNREIKNITYYPYENYTGSLEKQVYISKIGIFDKDKKLIGIAKLAKPVRKSESRDFTFKLKIDF